MAWLSGAANRRVRAVFLDRDGVINDNRADHVKSWDEFRFLPGVPDAIARLSSAGLRVFVISNQAIVNRRIVAREAIEVIHERMLVEIGQSGGRIEAVAWCPHRPDELCECRKPRPGLIVALAAAHGVDLSRAMIIGDALSDMEAGRAAGCGTILVLSGRGRAQLALATRREFAVVEDLSAAATLMLEQRVRQVRRRKLHDRTAAACE